MWSYWTPSIFELLSNTTVNFSRVNSLVSNSISYAFFFLFLSCSTDPTIIHLPSKLNSHSAYHYSFYLYNILKEPIPFQIQCRLLTKSPSISSNCSSIQTFDNDEQFIHTKFERKDSPYLTFRSSEIHVQRQISSQQNRSYISSKFVFLLAVFCLWSSIFSGSSTSILPVHYIQCFLFALPLFIHRTIFLIVCN